MNDNPQGYPIQAHAEPATPVPTPIDPDAGLRFSVGVRLGTFAILEATMLTDESMVYGVRIVRRTESLGDVVLEELEVPCFDAVHATTLWTTLRDTAGAELIDNTSTPKVQ